MVRGMPARRSLRPNVNRPPEPDSASPQVRGGLATCWAIPATTSPTRTLQKGPFMLVSYRPRGGVSIKLSTLGPRHCLLPRSGLAW